MGVSQLHIRFCRRISFTPSVDSNSSCSLLMNCISGVFLCQRCCTGIKEVLPKGPQQGSAGSCEFLVR
jgi:hypothetical protein